MKNIAPQFKGNLGLFLVCAELSKLNLVAMPTTRNTKGYDIVVLNPKTRKAAPIQVKCTDKRDFPILNTHWRDYEERIEEAILCDFVFVDIYNLNQPNYFIVSDKNLREILKISIKEYGHQYQRRHNLNWEEMLEKEEREKRKPNLWAIKLQQIEEFKDKWETITDRIY